MSIAATPITTPAMIALFGLVAILYLSRSIQLGLAVIISVGGDLFNFLLHSNDCIACSRGRRAACSQMLQVLE